MIGEVGAKEEGRQSKNVSTLHFILMIPIVIYINKNESLKALLTRFLENGWTDMANLKKKIL